MTTLTDSLLSAAEAMPRGSANNSNRHSGAVRRAEFEALYQAHSREVWALAYARRMDADLALDITQEAFLRLWKHWESSTEVIQKPRTWLMRVARNLADDYAKSAFRRNGTQPPELFGSVRSDQPEPMQQLEQQELFVLLRSELNALSAADREVLTLRYALDYETHQIAEMLGVDVTALHMRLSRARRRLSERLSTHGEFAPDEAEGGTES